MAITTKPPKVECLNPKTGGRINIDKSTYDLFSKAIYHTLKKEGAISFTQMVEGVNHYIKHQKIKFDGSVGWYTITVKNNMETLRVVEVFIEKGKKLHRLK